MKTLEWQNLFVEQAKFGKNLFTLTELANASGVPRSSLNVELSRLVKYGVATRYANGLYGLIGNSVSLEQLLSTMDPHAYVTGAHALMRHGLVTQVPIAIACFTNRRHFRREIQTPAGRMEFICVKAPIYRREVRAIAGPELALCDFVYITLRHGQDPVGLVSYRRLHTLRLSLLGSIVKRYPCTVRRSVAVLVGDKG